MADTASMRRQNLMSVLCAIDAGGDVTAAVLAEKTLLSAATISRALALLKAKGLVVQLGKERADCGRRPELFRLNAHYGYHLYFYLGGRCLCGYLLDFCGRHRARVQAEIDPACDAAQLTGAMENLRTQLLQACPGAKGHILAVSMALPGLVDGGVVSRIPNFPGLEQTPLAQQIRQAMGLPCFVYNVAKLNAMGEYLAGGDRADSLVYMDITDECGIGAGIVLNGRLYEGAGCRAGEIGDMVVGLPLDVQAGPSQGALEAQAGLSSVYAQARALLQSGGAQELAELLARRQSDVLDLRTLEKAASAMCLDILELLNKTTRIWAAAIVNLMAVLAPDQLILGGAVSSENKLIEAMVRRHLRRMYHGQVHLRLAKKNGQAHAAGAFFFSKQYLFEMAVNSAAEEAPDK